VRKGFTLTEMLAVMVVLAIISFALAGVFTTLITDIPRSYRIIQTNTTVLDMLERMHRDINAAKGLPGSFGQYATNEGLLLIEKDDGVISYQVKNDKVLRCNLTAAENGDVNDMSIWSVPHAKIKWQIWRENDKGYAVSIKTQIEHKVRDNWERKMANSHLYFVGVAQGAIE